MASTIISGHHYDWMSMLGVIESIRESHRCYSRVVGARRRLPTLRLDTIQEFLEPVWGGLPPKLQHALWEVLSNADFEIWQAAEGMSGRAEQQTLDPKFFFDVIPTEYVILQIVATRISENPWSLPIPEGFFEAALYDIVRLVGGDGGSYRWKQGIIDSSIGRGWKGTEPRAQFAMVEYTHRQLGEMRQLRGEATRDRWVEYGLTAQDFEDVRKRAEESTSSPRDDAGSAHAGPQQQLGLFPLMNNGLGHIPAQDLGFNNQALEIPSIAPDHGHSLHFRTLVPRSADPGGPSHFDPRLATSHFPPVSPFPAPSSDTTIQASRQDCQWGRMAFVLTSIQRSFERCNGRFCQGQLKPELRLHAIRSLLEPIWSRLNLETRLNVFNLLSKASDKMAETIEKKREEDPTKNYLKAFCDDKEPSSYEILEKIKPSASRWEYPVPRYFFEASLYEIIRATGKRVKRMGGWMTGIMTSTIGEEWEGNLPRAQLAMIEDTRKRARRLLAHAAAIQDRTAYNANARKADRKKACEPFVEFWEKTKPTVARYERLRREALRADTVADSSQAFDFNNLPAGPAYVPSQRMPLDHHDVLREPFHAVPPQPFGNSDLNPSRYGNVQQLIQSGWVHPHLHTSLPF